LVLTRTRHLFPTLSFYRGLRENEFDREQLSMLRMVAPHLRTALYTRSKLTVLESRISDLETALDRLDCGLVLLDATCRAVFINRNARAILDRNEGLSLHRGTLVAQSPSEALALRTILVKAVGAVKNTPSPGAMLISRLGRKPLQIVAGSFRPDMAGLPGRAMATIFITDPEQKTTTPTEILRTLFGFTRAESRLAVALLDGNSLYEAADLIGVARKPCALRSKVSFRRPGRKDKAN
jgi:hypothetical protein